MAKEKKQAKPSTEELRDLLQRTQANFENYRKQTEKRIADFQQFATKDILMDLLPILDNFNLALKNTSNHEQFKEGIELIYAELNKLLEKNDVEPLTTKNQTFDPYFHEALMKTPSDKPENTIIEEFQKGYTLHGKVLRTARVKVSAGNTNKEENKK